MDSEVRRRVLALVDELLRRGVPKGAVAEVLEWVDSVSGERAVGVRGWQPRSRGKGPE